MSVPLTIVIATHNRCDLLRRTLETLAQCTLPDCYRATLVVENGGEFGADQVVAEAAPALNARYLYHSYGNKSAATNAALEIVRDGVIVFFDDDLRVHEATITAYAQAAAQYSRGVFFGGPLRIDYEAVPPDWVIPHLPSSAAGWTWDGDHQQVDRPVFLGGNWAAYAQDLHDMGQFDPNFGTGSPTGSSGQETDMQRRMLAAGMRGEYVPDALVWHFVPQNRCTAEWTLRRRYQAGLQAGMSEDSPVPMVMGYPRWYFSAFAKSLAGYLCTRLVPNPRVRFNAAVELQKACGRLKGRQQRLRQDLLTRQKVSQ